MPCAVPVSTEPTTEATAPLASKVVPPDDAPINAEPVSVETTDVVPTSEEEPAAEEPYLEEPDILVIVAAPTAPGCLNAADDLQGSAGGHVTWS